MTLREEIRQLLTGHAGEPMDFVAIFMFLNTVAGGHYEDRHGEAAIREALAAAVAAGEIIETARADEPPIYTPGP